jgi:hypothetical protein
LRRMVLVAMAVLVTAGVVYVGLGSRDPHPQRSAGGPTATRTPSPTPLSSLDLSALPIERAPFCDRLDQGDVEDALGAPVSGTRHYENGQRAALAPGVRDVSHEFDCTYDAATGAQARVWVFAAPVTPAVAGSVVRDARREKGCSVLRRAPTYGTPSVGTLCRTTGPVGVAVTLRGLFGDAWLSCRLATPGDTGAAQRAEQWCVRVATTLGARP